MTPESGNSDGENRSSEGLPEGVVRDLLADERRRRLLSYIAEFDEPVGVEDIAEHVVAADVDERAGTDATAREASEAGFEAVRADIYEEHLPKLTATKVVSYDSMVGTIEPAAQWPAVREQLSDDDTE